VGAYADLVEPDRRTLHFVPGGLAAGTLHPDDAVAFQSALIADAVLVDAVPELLRSRFDRLRTKHVRGVSDYANFAEVCNLAIHEASPTSGWHDAVACLRSPDSARSTPAGRVLVLLVISGAPTWLACVSHTLPTGRGPTRGPYGTLSARGCGPTRGPVVDSRQYGLVEAGSANQSRLSTSGPDAAQDRPRGRRSTASRPILVAGTLRVAADRPGLGLSRASQGRMPGTRLRCRVGGSRRDHGLVKPLVDAAWESSSAESGSRGS
jgi:hypothetical protein